jgi:NTP pyrophosphatase (non-canonical NTP hydrolase)
MAEINYDTMEILMKIAQAQTKRFPAGEDPYKNVCRILEEAGEVAWEINHYERKGIPIDKGNRQDKEHIVLEAFQLCEVTCQLLQYFDLTTDFKDFIADTYQTYIEKGYIKTEETKNIEVITED